MYNDYEKPNSESKWEHELGFHPGNEWWKKHNNLVKSTSNDITLRWFHFRIIHRIIGTNNLLFKMRISDSNACTFCNNHPETVSHLFSHVKLQQILWKKFSLG